MIPLCDRSDIAPIRSTAGNQQLWMCVQHQARIDTITCTTAVQLRKARINMPVFLSVLFSHLLAAVRKGCRARERRIGCMAVKRLPLRVQLPPFPFVTSVMFLLCLWICCVKEHSSGWGCSFTLLNVCQHWMCADKCINLSNVKRIYFCIWF